MRLIANLATRGKFKYQYYDGYAFIQSPEIDYTDRRGKIEKELKTAINYMNSLKLGDDPVLNSEFINRMVQMTNRSLKNESILYEQININYPKQVNKNNITDFKAKSEKLSDEMTKFFVEREAGKFSFLKVLNDAAFLDLIVSKSTTTFTFTGYGNQNRLKGKKKATRGLSRAMSPAKNIKRSERYKPVRELVINDIIDMLNENADGNNKNLISTLDNETIKKVDAIIAQVIDSRFKKTGLMGIKTTKVRTEKLMNISNETLVKGFYKELYREFEKNFSRNLQKGLQPKGTYLGGALVIGKKIQETPYGTQVLSEIYLPPEAGSNDPYGEFNTNLAFDDFVEKFADFLINQIQIYGSSYNEPQAATFIKKKRSQLIKVLRTAYSLKGYNDQDKLRNFSLFAKSNISGLLGEIGAAFAFSSGDNKAYITGGEKNKLGQKVATDIQLEVYKKDGNKVVKTDLVGIQVKNYTSAKTVSLYQGTEIGLGNNLIERYISSNDLKVMKFLIANRELAKDKYGLNFSLEDLTQFLYVHFEQFIRINDLKSDIGEKTVANSFYYVNNRVVPASLLLAIFLEQAIELTINARKQKIFEINGSFPLYQETSEYEKGIDYTIVNTPEQPKAYKKNRTTYGRLIYARARFFENSDNETYPSIISENLMGNMRVRFNGIKIKT